MALPLVRGLILGSDALWFISRGVVAEDLERGDLVLLPTDARYLSGAVGLTRRQAGPDHPALDLLVQMTREGAQAGAYRWPRCASPFSQRARIPPIIRAWLSVASAVTNRNRNASPGRNWAKRSRSASKTVASFGYPPVV